MYCRHCCYWRLLIENLSPVFSLNLPCVNTRKEWQGINRKQISANGISEILLKSPLSTHFTKIKKLMAMPSLSAIWAITDPFQNSDRCVYSRREMASVLCSSVYFPLKSWVWSDASSVMFSCCGTMSTLEYNIWKTIVSTACIDLCFFLFGGLCSSSNLNVIWSNVLEDCLSLLEVTCH